MMDPVHRFSVAVGNLERTQLAIAGISTVEEGWRQRLIDLRRQLQAEIGALGEIAGGMAGLHRDSEAGARFWDALARMRTAVALHQARWPAVAIEPGDGDYLRSVANVRSANREFMGFAKVVVGQIH